MGQLVPDAVVEVVKRWRADGSPVQAGMAWPRERWVAMFPRHQEFLRHLPAALDRDALRSACLAAGTGPVSAEQGFIAVMAWGYGMDVGYGPWRTNRVISENSDAPQRLASVARCTGTNSALTAYRRMAPAGDCTLRWLGPAFATKYLYFCQPQGGELPALIFDNLVAVWLRRSAGLDLKAASWSVRTYTTYLEHMHRWASVLGCAPDELEYCIFREIATERNSQWAIMSSDVHLSERQALAAMRRFLQGYCNRKGETLVTKVLADTSAIAGTSGTKSTAWEEWVRCAREASNESP